MKRFVIYIIRPIITLAVVVVTLVALFTDKTERRVIEKEEEIDIEAPVIYVLEDYLEVFDTQEVDYLDYILVEDNSGKYEAKVLNYDELKEPGEEKTVKIEAKDPSGNKSTVELTTTIISEEEWNDYVNSKTYNYSYRKKMNEVFLEEKGPADVDAFNLALSFVGMRGSCNVVAQAFIDTYLGSGHDILTSTYRVTKEEALPGDIIYYTDGGLGEQHYAVYLGGCSALQGNVYGTTVIGSVYMNKGTTPQFFRCN